MRCTPGERETLAAVIEEHTATGEAVGSRAVARRLGGNVSSATIRNRMAGLEAAGLLDQPHTSAGRVPTDSGYRYYVDHLMPRPAPAEEAVRQVSASFHQLQDIEPALQVTCRLLAELTRQASLASIPDWESERLHYAEVTPINRHQVLLVVVGSSGRVTHTLATMPLAPDRATCYAFSQRLNARFAGEPLAAISVEGLATLARGLRAEPEFYRQAAEALRAPLHGDRPFLFEGASNIVGALSFRNAEGITSFMQLFEREQPLRALLSQAVPDRTSVTIGRETGHPALQDCALVTRTYRAANGSMGTVAILGPKRMRYDLAVATLNLVVDMLNRALWASGG